MRIPLDTHLGVRALPRTTERPVRKRGDEPRSNSVVIKRYVPYPTRLERGECSDLPVTLWSIIHD